MKRKILFVCLGNICRSPAAEEIFRVLADRAAASERYEIDSAGTYGGHSGDSAHPRMRSAAYVRGYHIGHRARRFVSDDFDRFDVIVAMDDSNYEHISRMAPDTEAQNKLCRMADFLSVSRARWDHIPDPYYEGAEGFSLVLDLLEEGCTEIFSRCESANIEYSNTQTLN